MTCDVNTDVIEVMCDVNTDVRGDVNTDVIELMCDVNTDVIEVTCDVKGRCVLIDRGYVIDGCDVTDVML